eukprot:gene9414-32792_t
MGVAPHTCRLQPARVAGDGGLVGTSVLGPAGVVAVAGHRAAGGYAGGGSPPAAHSVMSVPTGPCPVAFSVSTGPCPVAFSVSGTRRLSQRRRPAADAPAAAPPASMAQWEPLL